MPLKETKLYPKDLKKILVPITPPRNLLAARPKKNPAYIIKEIKKGIYPLYRENCLHMESFYKGSKLTVTLLVQLSTDFNLRRLRLDPSFVLFA